MPRLGVHGDSDDVTAVRNAGHGLPGLSTLSRACVHLGVEVALADPAKEFVEGWRRRG
jgi:hypothetical protein